MAWETAVRVCNCLLCCLSLSRDSTRSNPTEQCRLAVSGRLLLSDID